MNGASLLRNISGIGRQNHTGSHSPCPGSHSHSIATLIFRVPGVPLDPMESHTHRLHQGIQTHPQIGIFHLCKTGPSPFEYPIFIVGFDDIRRIAHNVHHGRPPAYALKPLNDSHKLHSVIGRKGIASAEFLSVISATQHCSPATRTRVAAGSTVSIEINGWACSHLTIKQADYSIILPPRGLISVSGNFTFNFPSSRSSCLWRALNTSIAVKMEAIIERGSASSRPAIS